MSIHARLRILLAVSVLVIGGSVWVIAGQQRQAVVGMQAQLQASSDLLTAMLDQETGLRGYALTAEQSFLEPYRRGTGNFERALRAARDGARGDAVTATLLHDLTATTRLWQANARTSVDQVRRGGPRALSLEDTRSRKALMDRFRGQNAELRVRVERRAQARLQEARWMAFGFVMVFGTLVLSFGMVALERQARRERERATQRREYIEALQGADDELEAKDLLRRRAERLAPGSAAVVLTRNASGNSLHAATDPAVVPGLADALEDAAPRSCRAIRRGTAHERQPGSAPLQPCKLCDRVDGGSVCVPELVGGEVIGSLLVVKDGAVKPAERESIVGDEVLETVGATLRRGVRASDFAGRWGGEEFVMLLPDTDHEGAMRAAETMRGSLDGVQVPGVTAHVTASLGVATLPEHAVDGPSLIRAADRALYAAKEGGRNRVAGATSDDRRPVES